MVANAQSLNPLSLIIYSVIIDYMVLENELEYNCTRSDPKFFSQYELFDHFRAFHS